MAYQPQGYSAVAECAGAAQTACACPDPACERRDRAEGGAQSLRSAGPCCLLWTLAALTETQSALASLPATLHRKPSPSTLHQTEAGLLQGQAR